MIHEDQIAKAIAAYLERHPGEAERLAPVGALLAEPGDITSRKTFTGHVTCSAIVVNTDRQVLHIRHNALGVWLRPGGHLEADDMSLADAAVREVEEETGLSADHLTLVNDIPVDVDVHPIPANDAKAEPAHQHFDLRFLFTTRTAGVVTLQAEEVNDFAWLPLNGIEPKHLRARLATMLG